MCRIVFMKTLVKISKCARTSAAPTSSLLLLQSIQLKLADSLIKLNPKFLKFKLIHYLICRAYFGGQLLPATLSIRHLTLTTSLNNKEHKLTTEHHGEMLIKSNYKWVKVDDGLIPKNAVIGGLLSNSQNLYIGKASHEDTVVVGRVSADGALYAPWKEGELVKNSFEILVKDVDQKSLDSCEFKFFYL